ncbi:hypothetical protein BJ085DRAFT_41190 [Dimargaris cristalligena]|uniref:RecQ-mediated genome instability protein 1 n=1 Tax=Dimargaris cristalligena TaxID=215637 RepID=A0A4P9ZWC8_9FUNG|nr:hypothetical protein BJ085DRAFT_41190 [Dimargaris cristalligena]|eukprot:RKP37618.1 hypothetical protein BJ085DRAFT_41190 [Dimargaris cristalligena]
MELAALQTKLRERAIQVQPNWLEQCVRFLNSPEGQLPTPPPPGAATDALLEGVYEQYLASDLAHMGLPTLSDHCLTLHKTTLTPVGPSDDSQGEGRPSSPSVILQVVDVMDIGIPTLQITDKLEELEVHQMASRLEMSTMAHALLANFPNEGGEKNKDIAIPRGTLKFILSDGFRQIPAVEYRPIPALDITLPLGTKFLLRNAEVLRGMVMLNHQNCFPLGGAVEALNTMPLLDRLRAKIGQTSKPPVHTTHNITHPPQNHTPSRPNNTVPTNGTRSSRPNPPDLELLGSDDITPDDIEALEMIEAENQYINDVQQREPQKPSPLLPPNQYVIDLDSDFEADLDFKAIDLTQNTTYVTLDKLDQCITAQTYQVITKAKVTSLSKFQLKGDGFSQVVQITDGHGQFPVRLASHVIAQRVGFTVQAFRNSLKEPGSTKYTEYLYEIRAAISALEGLMTVDLTEPCRLRQMGKIIVYTDPKEVTSEEALPIITEVKPIG